MCNSPKTLQGMTNNVGDTTPRFTISIELVTLNMIFSVVITSEESMENTSNIKEYPKDHRM